MIVDPSSCMYSYRTTIFTEYSILVKTHEDLGNYEFSSKFTYNHYRMAWYAFTQLLDVDLQQGFVCNICGDNPRRVIMDATSLSFRKDFDPWKNFLAEPTKTETKLKEKR